eukprot:1167012-Amphidinium_carterae.1
MSPSPGHVRAYTWQVCNHTYEKRFDVTSALQGVRNAKIPRNGWGVVGALSCRAPRLWLQKRSNQPETNQVLMREILMHTGDSSDNSLSTQLKLWPRCQPYPNDKTFLIFDVFSFEPAQILAFWGLPFSIIIKGFFWGRVAPFLAFSLNST